MQLLPAHKKRLIMRAQHRGMKEMDIIMGGYVEKQVQDMSDERVELLENFMSENDQRLYQMILGNEVVPEEYVDLVSDLRLFIGLSV